MRLPVDGMINYAQSKPAWSSGNLPNWGPENGVDGNLGTCFHSDSSETSTWTVDLQKAVEVRQIRIFNRQDGQQYRLQGAVVSILDFGKHVVVSSTVGLNPGMEVTFDFNDIEGRYVEITLEGEFLHFTDVMVIGGLSHNGMPNLAIGRSAYQTSTFENFNANLAIDGDINTSSHTLLPESGYLQVDMLTHNPRGAVAVIRHVNIWNRLDCCKERIEGAHVQVLDANEQVLGEFKITDKKPETFGGSFDDIERRYVRVSHEGNYLNIGELEIYGTWKQMLSNNLALNKPVSSSSEMATWEAERGNDGHTGSITHTFFLPGWWEVDLEFSAHIDLITIYNRPDCCQERIQGAVVTVYDKHHNFVASKTIDEYPAVIELEFDEEIIVGRYVNITSDINFLHFSEFEVYGGYI